MEIVMFKVNSSQPGPSALLSTLHIHMLMSYLHKHTHAHTRTHQSESSVVCVRCEHFSTSTAVWRGR